MQNILMLAAAGLRKSKRQALSQGVIIFFAAMLFNLGLLTAISFGDYFDEKAEELNSAHVAAAFNDQGYNESYLRWFQQQENVTATQKDRILMLPANLKMPLGNLTNLVFCLDYDNMGAMSQVQLVGPSLPINERSVYVPYVFQFSGGLTLGSTLTIGLDEELYDNSKETEYDFTVAGFTEDILLGVTNTGAVGLYFNAPGFRDFSAKLPDYYSGTLISAQLTDHNESTAFLDDFINATLGGEDTTSWGMSISVEKFARTVSSNIISMIVVAFSIIVLIVSQIVIRFRIKNTIEEEMRNYGALKAIGHTSAQIIASIALQFALVTFLISILGIALSYVAVYVMSAALATQTGLNWVQGFDLPISSICLTAVVLTTVITAVFASLQLRKMLPIKALRVGANAGTVRWNVFPLENASLPLTPILAAKTVVLNLKQNIMIVIIMAAVGFSVVFSVVLGYNAPRDTFINMLIGQYADLSISVNPKTDVYEILDEIYVMDGVQNAVIGQEQFAIYDEQFLNVTVLADFSHMLNNQTYRGRNPSHQNEAVISGMLGGQTGKGIGDTLTLSLNGRAEEYIITGYFQSTNNMGREALLTTEGFRLLEPDYKETIIGVRISKETDIDMFIDNLEQRYGERIADIFNVRELLNIQLTSILGMINGVISIIEGVTVLIVSFILYLVVRTLVLRRRQDLGIQKAIGFTTFQLMNQIAGSFVPVAVLGSGIGGVLGCLTMNACVGLLFRSLGVMKVNFIVPIPSVITACALMCLLTYVVSLLVSLRIRDISAYALIVE
ncbi:MAG: ABC transporter permease [Oscillospiraceae bacterium]|nr:ABC transporter permease [Oscillospiraceae bacterium]